MITGGLFYGTEVSTLKVIHLEPFSNELMKVKIFILQIDNKIADAVGTSEERKIWYKMSLLQKLMAEWAVNYIINTEEDTF